MANKYLSDLHLGHAHILEMSKRGEKFADVEEMSVGMKGEGWHVYA